MVLFKRKRVVYVPKPVVLKEDNEIWVINETDEIFTDYDEYLERMDYYRQKKFSCEVSGTKDLSFFDALREENSASHEIESTFPDPLREPILRKVQLSTISRIDNLVDHVYDEFKNDFYPGETVTVTIDSEEKFTGTIREKSRFAALLRPDGSVERKAFSRYFVSLAGNDDEEALVDNDHIQRDRKAFTKAMIRSFLKNSLIREAWTGAPWLVKDKIAQEYRISTEVPHHLKEEYAKAQRKAQQQSKKEQNGDLGAFQQGGHRLPELKPKVGKPLKVSSQELEKQRQEQFLSFQRALASNPAFRGYGQRVPPSVNDPEFPQWMNGHPQYYNLLKSGVPRGSPPPTPKGPIEDLEVSPAKDVSARPALKFIAEDTPIPYPPSERPGEGIEMQSVGLLLETWDTLNVYAEVYLLDSFTFDDYIEALQFSSEEMQCELVNEIHCALLKKLVNAEKDQNGQCHIQLPAMAEDDSDEESEEDSSAVQMPTPEPEVRGRTTRSSLAKKEANEIKAQEPVLFHRAAEIDGGSKAYNWKRRMQKRDFANGRWIIPVVGLLNIFTLKPRLKALCEELLIQLAPVDMDASEETPIYQYASLDINTRVKIIQFLCTLSLETPAIRGYMDDCTASMTRYRKEKIEHQRERKAALEELKALDEERRALQPDAASPIVDIQELEYEDEEMKDPDDDETVENGDGMETEDDGPVPARRLRRADDRAAERKRKLEEAKMKKVKAEADRLKKPTKEARQLEKVLKKIEECQERITDCEAEIQTCNDDLREADCPRTRVLGLDRFWNRYYWLERNAMPYAGLPNSSTADAGYANGCIWVQGPDDIERLGFIELSDEENQRYCAAYLMTVPDRKILEEGLTHTFNAHQWGFYDSPDDLDNLLAWLNPKGVREAKLRKELSNQRENIAFYMEARKAYLSKEEEILAEEPATRVSTRTKTYINPTGKKFLAWHNGFAVRELGHLHSEAPKPGRKGVARVVSRTKPPPVEIDEPRQTRGSNKQVEEKKGRSTRGRY